MSPATAKRPRVRLDQLLVERGLVETRTRAQALVLAGKVRVGEGDRARRDRKPGDLVDPQTAVDLVQREPYVSRGGHKLAAALDAFEIDPKDMAPVEKRFTMSCAVSTSFSGTGARPVSSAFLMRKRPRMVLSSLSCSFTRRAYSR